MSKKKKELSVNPFAQGNHPNEKGHEIISKNLIEHIEYANIIA